MVGCGRIVGFGVSEIGITVFPMQMVGVMTLRVGERRMVSRLSPIWVIAVHEQLLITVMGL